MDSRLFLRFLLVYAAAVPVAVWLLLRGYGAHFSFPAGRVQLLFLALALLGAFSIVSRPYLLLLTAIKAFFDVGVMSRVIEATAGVKGGFFAVNAAFFLVVIALLVFCTAAAKACLFSFFAKRRDAALLFSRECLSFLTEAVLFLAISFLLCLLWQQILL